MLSMVLFVSDTGMGNVPHVDGDDAPPPLRAESCSAHAFPVFFLVCGFALELAALRISTVRLWSK